MKYLVKEEDNITIATQENCSGNFRKLFNKFCEKEGIKNADALLYGLPDFSPDLTDKIKAIAICDERDAFDFDIGMNIASKKLIIKEQSRILKKADQLTEQLKKVLTAIDNIKFHAASKTVDAIWDIETQKENIIPKALP